MRFPDTYFTVEDHLFKVSCRGAHKDEKNGIVADMKIEEVDFSV